MNNAILTKDNLIKRRWSGAPTCYFCNSDENIQHLFFQCSTAKSIWALQLFAFMLLVPEISLNPLISVGIGVSFGFLLVQNFIRWALQLFAGLYGKLVTPSALKVNPLLTCCDCLLLMFAHGFLGRSFFWSDKESLLEGVNTMLAIAMKLVAKKKKQGHLLLKDGQDEAQD